MTANPDLGIRFWTPSSVLWHRHPCGSPLSLQPFVATPSRLLPWSALKVLWSSRPQETGRRPRREARTGILEENYSPIARGMALSNPLAAEVAGYYGDSSFFPVFGGKL